jgi:tetratricopeptide (TPR) repeat protein
VVRASRGPRAPKDPDLERRKIEERTLDEWIDDGDVRAEARAASRRASGPGASGRSRDRRRPVDAATAASIEDLVGAQRGARLNERLVAAATALERNRLDEAQRIIRPLVDELPQVAAVRRISGLTAYRLGRWRRAVEELEAAHALDPSVDHLPVLADANRALKRWRRVDELWAAIRAESPAHEVMAEGRIVAAGAAADRGDLHLAIEIMEPAIRKPKRVREHHLRQWYVLGDLHDRAGDPIAAARYFELVAAHDREFADVRFRLDALGR